MTLEMTAPAAWAHEEFGTAALGDRRRTARLVTLATAAAQRPAGTITQVCDTDAARQGAYGLLRNAAVTPAAIAAAAHAATARRAADLRFVYVPLDDSSVVVTDRTRTKGIGSIGARAFPTRGLKVMTALAIAPDRTPLGVADQQYWVRPARRPQRAARRRPRAQKESRFWAQGLAHVVATFATHAPGCQPWAQLDRGGDVGFVLAEAVAAGWRVTVRAAQNRRLVAPGRKQFLWPTVARPPALGTLSLDVRAGRQRRARTAQLAVRACPVTLRVTDKATGQRRAVTVMAVHAREVGTTPRGERPLEWMLLTTAWVRTFDDAVAVVRGYATRWLVEEFHEVWKSHGCDVEASELRAADRLQKWAIVLASVAVRVLRLTRLARTTPAAPAAGEFARDEIDAAILLRQPAGYQPGDTPTLGEVVRWIADEGGYTGPGSGGPPGKVVIGRGLERIMVVAEALAAQRKLKM